MKLKMKTEVTFPQEWKWFCLDKVVVKWENSPNVAHAFKKSTLSAAEFSPFIKS